MANNLKVGESCIVPRWNSVKCRIVAETDGEFIIAVPEKGNQTIYKALCFPLHPRERIKELRDIRQTKVTQAQMIGRIEHPKNKRK
jgi:hypothetical protein